MSGRRRTLGRKTAITSQSMLATLALAQGPGPAKAKAAPAPVAKAGPAVSAVSAEERRRMIARVAYARAERARFSSNPLEDWLSAEREVDAELARAS